MATFEPQRTVFRNHQMSTKTILVKGASDGLELKTGAILAYTAADTVALATDAIEADKVCGIVFGPATLSASETTQIVVAVHADAIAEECTIAEGATMSKVADVLKTVGLYVY